MGTLTSLHLGTPEPRRGFALRGAAAAASPPPPPPAPVLIQQPGLPLISTPTLTLALTLTRYSSDEGSQEGSCDEGEGEVLSPELRVYCLVEAEGPTKVLTRSLPLTLPLPLPDYSMPLPPMLTQAHQC